MLRFCQAVAAAVALVLCGRPSAVIATPFEDRDFAAGGSLVTGQPVLPRPASAKPSDQPNGQDFTGAWLDPGGAGDAALPIGTTKRIWLDTYATAGASFDVASDLASSIIFGPVVDRYFRQSFPVPADVPAGTWPDAYDVLVWRDVGWSPSQPPAKNVVLGIGSPAGAIESIRIDSRDSEFAELPVAELSRIRRYIGRVPEPASLTLLGFGLLLLYGVYRWRGGDWRS